MIMTFTRTQSQVAYKKLPPEIQDLIMSNETTDLIATTLKEAGLSEEQANLADSEILYTLFCLQSLDDAINNIAKVSNRNANDLSKIRSVIQDNILNKYKIDIRDFIETNKTTKTVAPETTPANLPMVEPGEVVHSVPHVEPNPSTTLPQQSSGQVGASNPPVPTTPAQIKPEQPNVSIPDYRYDGGKDPYREPLK